MCFLSLHVDGAIPGDRDTQCHGKMFPTEYEIKNGQTKIHFVCVKCEKEHRNKAANDDELGQLDAAIILSRKEFKRVK